MIIYYIKILSNTLKMFDLHFINILCKYIKDMVDGKTIKLEEGYTSKSKIKLNHKICDDLKSSFYDNENILYKYVLLTYNDYFNIKYPKVFLKEVFPHLSSLYI
jgi:hypothetical protein